MRTACLAAVFGVAAITGTQSQSYQSQTSQSASRPGVLLEALTWQEAERVLTPGTVVVIPMGAQAKEHGPHLKLNNDFTMAEYFKRRVLEATDNTVVVAPTINYGFYPAFVDYPGTTTVSLETAPAPGVGL